MGPETATSIIRTKTVTSAMAEGPDRSLRETWPQAEPRGAMPFTNSWLTVFFFVDDIVLLYRARHQDAADEFIVKLKSQYEMKDLGELKWFLGIRVLRDRAARKLWLCQDSYIEKIVNQYGCKGLSRCLFNIRVPYNCLSKAKGKGRRRTSSRRASSLRI